MTDVIVRVKPGSKKGPLIETDADDTLTIYVREKLLTARPTKLSSKCWPNISAWHAAVSS